MLDKYHALTEKMVAAQGKGDMKLAAVYQDSAMAMKDPSCIVKQPEQPKDYSKAQRASDGGAEEKEVEASGFPRGELALVKERAVAILSARTSGRCVGLGESGGLRQVAELKPLLGINDPAAEQAAKPAPAAGSHSRHRPALPGDVR